MDANEICFRTGNFTDDCNCELCYHKEECSGYDHGDDFDNEDDE